MFLLNYVLLSTRSVFSYTIDPTEASSVSAGVILSIVVWFLNLCRGLLFSLPSYGAVVKGGV